MLQIEKNQLKQMLCPKCGKTKLRFDARGASVEAAAAATAAAEGKGRGVRCDACKKEFLSSHESLQSQQRQILANLEPTLGAAGASSFHN
jgi:hypothetical protein